MNLDDTIQELRAEKEKLERVIASLEELRATTHGIPTVAPTGHGPHASAPHRREYQVR
jgi:hypothetical protein